MRAAQSAAVKRLLAQDTAVLDLKVRPSRVLAKLNEANWPYYLTSSDGQFVEPLNSLDCIRIHLQYQKLKKDCKAKSLLFLPLAKTKLSVKTMEAKRPDRPNEMLSVVR